MNPYISAPKNLLYFSLFSTYMSGIALLAQPVRKIKFTIIR